MKKTALLSAGIALLVACGGGPGTIYVRGVQPMNENDRKESVSVDIRIYQLKDDQRFNQATVDKLWTDEKAALGEDLVTNRKEATVVPGRADDREQEIQLGEVSDSVRFIGVLALYQKEDERGPRKIIFPKGEGKVLRFTGYHVEKEK